jgi:hypothetical protein
VEIKGTIAMYEIESLKIDGVEIHDLKKALKRANKDMNKLLRKKAKSGELGDLNMGM